MAQSTVIAARTVRYACVVECIKAAHLSTYVNSPFQNSCGIFLVGSPGVMKTTLLETLDGYEAVLPLSDVNTKMLSTVIKRQITNNTIKTLVFPEMQRLYERDPRTSSGVEGTIRSLVEEGYRGASLEDPTALRFRARCCVIGAMTESFRDDNWNRWVSSGFARRFLWCLLRLSDPRILLDAVEFGRMASIDGDVVSMPTPLAKIPALPESVRVKIRPLVRKQPGPQNVAYEILCRMGAVLDFYYKRSESKNGHPKKDVMKTLIEFSNCLLGGADLIGLSFGPDVE